MRERLRCFDRFRARRGITPACAGTTKPKLAVFTHCRDHPRLCGNDVPLIFGRLRNRGSPPLVRERLLLFFRHFYHYRITPACAGTTPPRQDHAKSPQDHPRLCGNDAPVLSVFSSSVGSPPLVRERLSNRKDSQGRWRITPACAGTTDLPIIGHMPVRDHPRLCGNDISCVQTEPLNGGSPPLVRERLSLLLAKAKSSGITPACAGTTAYGGTL